MAKKTRRTPAETRTALNVIGSAIERFRDLVDHAVSNPVTKGLQRLASAAPKLMERLERDQGKLQGELDKRRSEQAESPRKRREQRGTGDNRKLRQKSKAPLAAKAKSDDQR